MPTRHDSDPPCPNTPRIGEFVSYCMVEDGHTVIAIVTRVIYWDLIDVRIVDTGQVFLGVRRVIADHAIGESSDCADVENRGKFRRLPHDRRQPIKVK